MTMQDSVLDQFEHIKRKNIVKKDDEFVNSVKYKKMLTEAMDAYQMATLKIKIFSKLTKLLSAQEKTLSNKSCLEKVRIHPISEFDKLKTYWQVYDDLDLFIRKAIEWAKKYLPEVWKPLWPAYLAWNHPK